MRLRCCTERKSPSSVGVLRLLPAESQYAFCEHASTRDQFFQRIVNVPDFDFVVVGVGQMKLQRPVASVP